MIRKKLTFANVTAFIALFVALSAGSYAAVKIPANSVGHDQLKARAVTHAKLGNNAVGASNIQGNAVDGSKVKDGSLTGADINLGTLGKVPSAAAADTAGAASIARVKVVTATGSAPQSGGLGTATATCDSGLNVVGGGASLPDEATGFVNDSYPSSATAWTAHAYSWGSNASFTVYAICAPAASTQ